MMEAKVQIIQKCEKGVAMVEFAIAGLLYFMIIGFLFDVMVMYFHNHVTITTVNTAVRAMAINFPSQVIGDSDADSFHNSLFLGGIPPEQREVNVGRLNDLVKSRILTHLNQNYSSKPNEANLNVQVDVQINRSGIGGAVLTIEASMDRVCVFCFFPLPVRATAQAVIEDECFY